MRHIPLSFRRLVAAFPDHAGFPAAALLNSIGGQVRQSVRDTDNTCAVRLSYMLNHGGAPLRRLPGPILWRESAPQPGTPMAPGVRPPMVKNLFLIRANDVKEYLSRRYGAGTLIWDGYHPDKFKVPFTGATQGIIVFEWKGPFRDFGALGHADLFRVLLTPGTPPMLTPACVGQCYWQHGPMYAYLWETNP